MGVKQFGRRTIWLLYYKREDDNNCIEISVIIPGSTGTAEQGGLGGWRAISPFPNRFFQKIMLQRVAHKEQTDTLSLIDIGNLFACNKNRHINFGRFMKDEEL